MCLKQIYIITKLYEIFSNITIFMYYMQLICICVFHEWKLMEQHFAFMYTCIYVFIYVHLISAYMLIQCTWNVTIKSFGTRIYKFHGELIFVCEESLMYGWNHVDGRLLSRSECCSLNIIESSSFKYISGCVPETKFS